MSFAPRNLIGTLLASGLMAAMLAAPATLSHAQDAATPAETPAAATPAETPAAAPAETPAETPAAATELDPLLAGANLERGRDVYAKVGLCVSCHGWDGDGKGKNPRSQGAAALLRESGLDAQGFIEIIACGIPGTPMPFHDNQAYKDDRCYGMTADMFEEGQTPIKGKSIKKEDIVNLVAYIQTSIQGKPAATYDDCAAYFGASAEKACAQMKK